MDTHGNSRAGRGPYGGVGGKEYLVKPRKGVLLGHGSFPFPGIHGRRAFFRTGGKTVPVNKESIHWL